MALGAFVSISALASSEQPAAACGGAVSMDVSVNVQRLRRAQASLETGRYQSARAFALPVRLAGDEDEREEANWITAMSYVRDEYATEGELRDSIQTMREIRAHRTLSDVKSKVDLGEALSRIKSTQEEARTLLEPLAEQDLIGSDHAYAQLVRVGSSFKVRFNALQRCRAMTDDKSLCTNGFIAERASVLDSARLAWWMPRVFATLSGFAGLAAIYGLGLVVVRRRRRTAAIAAFA